VRVLSRIVVSCGQVDAGILRSAVVPAVMVGLCLQVPAADEGVETIRVIECGEESKLGFAGYDGVAFRTNWRSLKVHEKEKHWVCAFWLE
jgi:hypothetical protein